MQAVWTVKKRPKLCLQFQFWRSAGNEDLISKVLAREKFGFKTVSSYIKPSSIITSWDFQFSYLNNLTDRKVFSSIWFYNTKHLQTINKRSSCIQGWQSANQKKMSRGNLCPSQKKPEDWTRSWTVSAFDEWTLSASRKQQLFTKVCSWMWSFKYDTFCKLAKKGNELWK